DPACPGRRDPGAAGASPRRARRELLFPDMVEAGSHLARRGMVALRLGSARRRCGASPTRSALRRGAAPAGRL
ncbi:MAG: hypothetical protein AVDCRST_MAG27-4528, partial [uncultured Craurococcus sp.]